MSAGFWFAGACRRAVSACVDASGFVLEALAGASLDPGGDSRAEDGRNGPGSGRCVGTEGTRDEGGSEGRGPERAMAVSGHSNLKGWTSRNGITAAHASGFRCHP